MLLTYHNLYFLHSLVLGAREAIEADAFPAYKKAVLERYAEGA